jgi:nucleolar protein 16
LTQNYKRLGLTSRINGLTGGVEQSLQSPAGTAKPIRDSLSKASVEKAVVREAKVERDADGKIIRVLDGGGRNPLNDPLNDLETDSEEEEGGGEENQEEWGGIDDEEEAQRPEVVRLLEKQASIIPEKKPRYQSQQEAEWVERLIEKHGDDVASMVRDRKLNPMQQTKADIARRIRRYKGLA